MRRNLTPFEMATDQEGRRTAIEEKNKSRNAVYVRRHPHGKAKTSARAIRSRQRQAEVLQYRLMGHSYAAIGKQMKIPSSTACDYAIRALASIVPAELPKQVLAQELLKLDAMQTGIYQQAVAGDATAIEAMLSIMRMRARLCGLIDTKHPDRLGLNVNISGSPNAEDTGIEVRFIHPTRRDLVDGDQEQRAADAAKVISGWPMPDL